MLWFRGQQVDFNLFTAAPFFGLHLSYLPSWSQSISPQSPCCLPECVYSKHNVLLIFQVSDGLLMEQTGWTQPFINVSCGSWIRSLPHLWHLSVLQILLVRNSLFMGDPRFSHLSIKLNKKTELCIPLEGKGIWIWRGIRGTGKQLVWIRSQIN